MSKQSEAVIRWRRRTKQKMVDAMGGCCAICKYDKCLEAMDFHHIDPKQKEFGFGKITANPKTINKLINELKKCVLLCSRCHREIHAGMIIVTEPSKLDESKLLSEAKLKKALKQQKINTTRKIDRRKIFLSNEQLSVMLKEYNGNKSALARHLYVSETAIRKRFKTINIDF